MYTLIISTARSSSCSSTRCSGTWRGCGDRSGGMYCGSSMCGSSGEGRGQAQYQAQAPGTVMGQKRGKQLADL